GGPLLERMLDLDDFAGGRLLELRNAGCRLRDGSVGGPHPAVQLLSPLHRLDQLVLHASATAPEVVHLRADRLELSRVGHAAVEQPAFLALDLALDGVDVVLEPALLPIDLVDRELRVREPGLGLGKLCSSSAQVLAGAELSEPRV